MAGAGTGFHFVVANRAPMCTADCYKENNLTCDCHNRTADCHEENTVISPQIATVKSRSLRADCHGVICFMAVRSTVHSKAVCHGVIPVMANHGIGAWFATKD
jgi:hypothetical protein